MMSSGLVIGKQTHFDEFCKIPVEILWLLMTKLFARVKTADYFFFILCSLNFASQGKLQSTDL